MGASNIEFLFQVSRYWYRPDTGQHTVPCENVKLLCLEFMLESAEEQHGLIL